MDEITKITISSLSSTFQEYFNDVLQIERNGTVSYEGTVGEDHRKWNTYSNSPGFQIIYSSLVLEILTMDKTRKCQEQALGSYEIRLENEENCYVSAMFYGTMLQNEQEELRNILLDVFPPYEELPIYFVEHIKDNQKNEIIS